MSGTEEQIPRKQGRSLYEFYILLVCLCSLIGLVATLFWLFFAVLSWLDPELMTGYAYADYQTNEQFWECRYRYYRRAQDDAVKPSDEELTRKRLTSYDALLEGRRRFGKQFTLLNAFGVLLSGVVFATHWRLVRRARAEAIFDLAGPE
jgi:hypothetical protein